MADKTGKAVRTRESILLAAASEFARAGYKGATHENMLQILGKRTPNYITYHFKTKTDLAEAVFARQDELWDGYRQALSAEGVTGIEAMVAVFFMMLRDHRNFPVFQAAIVLDSDPAAPRTGPFRPCAAWLRLVGDYLEQARAGRQIDNAVDVDEEAWMIVSNLYGIYQLGQQLDVTTSLLPRFERAWRQLLEGLGVEHVDKLIDGARRRASRDSDRTPP